MSVEVALSTMVATAVEQALAPLINSLAQLAQVATMLGTPANTAVPAATVKRGPGRPKAVEVSQDAPVKRGRGRPKKTASDSETKMCAVIDCGRPARSKGYCAAHYQKFRMLEKTDRLPADWVADAAPNSVENIMLPRGRAGAKALAEMR